MDAAHRGLTALAEGEPSSVASEEETGALSGGGGNALPDDVRAKMEHAFGTDFSGVRIIEGHQAASLGALAYTQGTNIHFAPGQYEPHSQHGQELLGHELAHVAQQAEGKVRATAQAKGLAINADPSLEREADELGARAARWEPEEATAERLGQGRRESADFVQMKCARCEDAGESGSTSEAVSSEGGNDESCETCETDRPGAQKAKDVLARNGVQFKKSPIQAKPGVVQLHSKADCDTWYETCNEGCRRLPNRTKADKLRRALCWSGCTAEYATCLASTDGVLTFAAIVTAIVLASADGPFPVGDAAAAALLMSLGIMPD